MLLFTQTFGLHRKLLIFCYKFSSFIFQSKTFFFYSFSLPEQPAPVFLSGTYSIEACLSFLSAATLMMKFLAA